MRLTGCVIADAHRTVKMSKVYVSVHVTDGLAVGSLSGFPCFAWGPLLNTPRQTTKIKVWSCVENVTR